MKGYRYAQLRFGDHGVFLRSTDSQVLDWILAELKTVITNFRVSEGPELPSGEKYFVHIDKLRYKDSQVGWWILKKLCLQGWEPFGVHDTGRIEEYIYHLRLEGNAK